MNSSQMPIHVAASRELPAANTALVFGRIGAMNSSQVFTQVSLLCELLAANLTLECWSVSAVNSPQMKLQAAGSCKLPAANLALVSGVKMHYSRRRSGAALSLYPVRVSAGR